MKYLKIFEAEIKKSFTDWLKNPKAPTKIQDKYNYIFAKPVRLQEELVDNGDFSTYLLLKFIEEENGEDIFREISNELGVDYKSIKKDCELLDESFEKWIRKYKGGWSEFLSENMIYLNEINIQSFRAIKSSFEEEIKSENGISYDFDDYLHELEYDGKDIKVYDIKIADEQELKKINNKEYFDTDNNIFFVVTTNRILEEYESGLLSEYIQDKIDNLSFSEERVYKKISDGERLKFHSKIIFEPDSSNESDFINWKIKLVYKPKI